jgi:hypothetical protein
MTPQRRAYGEHHSNLYCMQQTAEAKAVDLCLDNKIFLFILAVFKL